MTKMVTQQEKISGYADLLAQQKAGRNAEKQFHLIDEIFRGCHALDGPAEHFDAVCGQRVLLDELACVPVFADDDGVVEPLPVFFNGQVPGPGVDKIIHPPGVAVHVDDRELPGHPVQGIPAVAVDEGLLEQGLGHGGVDVVPVPVAAHCLDAVFGKLFVQQAVQGAAGMDQVVGGVGHEPEQSLVLVHQGILFLGGEGIGKRIPGVADPVVQEQGLAGGGIDEQSPPEGRGMEEKSQGPEMFFSLDQEGGGKTGVWGGSGLHVLSAGHGRAVVPGRVWLPVAFIRQPHAG